MRQAQDEIPGGGRERVRERRGGVAQGAGHASRPAADPLGHEIAAVAPDISSAPSPESDTVTCAFARRARWNVGICEGSEKGSSNISGNCGMIARASEGGR